MNIPLSVSSFPCGQVSRRRFLADMGMGFTGMALGGTLMSDGIARAGSPGGGARPSCRGRSR